MRLFVGLGNPGKAHAAQRHNIGFMAAEHLRAHCGFGVFRPKFEGLLAEAGHGSGRLLLLLPMTFMNHSGRSVGAACRFHKLPPDRVTVLHDELDLAPGKVRVKTGGGAAGHNGLRSIRQHLQSDGFRRVRMGIGHPGDRSLVTSHVLGNFSKSDRVWLDSLLAALAGAFPDLVAGEDAKFMSRLAQQQAPAKPRRARTATPADTTPADTTPADTTPADTTSADTTSADTIVTDATAGNPASGGPAAGTGGGLAAAFHTALQRWRGQT